MRRENRKNNRKKTNDKAITYGMLGAAILVIAIIGIMTYNNIHKDSNKYANLENNRINSIGGQAGNTQSASTQVGKTVNEVQNQNTTNSTNTTNTINANEIKNTINAISNTLTKNVTKNTTLTTKSTVATKTNEESKELEFVKPVDGEISKEFAKDQLIYSNTLDEWTTHLGVDIKSEEGTEVVAAEEGTVKSIKNDPRYGVVITIEHKDGYQSVYSNLQPSEEIVEGEKVDKGQTIATIGNTAAFEAKDEAHLHFEILKDYKQVDPTTYIK